LHIYAELLTSREDIKVLAITWNMARKQQTPDLNMLLPNPENHDLIILACQESHKRKEFLERLDKYMQSHNFN